MNAPLVIAAVTVAGALVGLGSGALAVALEKFEKLEAEEQQERLEYERDVAEEQSRAAAAGEEPEPARPGQGNVMAGPGWNAGSRRRSAQSASVRSPRTTSSAPAC